MIGLVEGAQRQKTPNEIALTVLLVGMTLIFLVTTGSLESLAIYSGVPVPVVYLIALLATLIPTTTAGLLSAIALASWAAQFRPTGLPKSARPAKPAADAAPRLPHRTAPNPHTT